MKLQERYPDPWRMLVCCILLNRARGDNATIAAGNLFENWPTPEDLFARASLTQLTEALRPLGLQKMRACRILSLTSAWLGPDGEDVRAGVKDVRELPGCGQYAWESWAAFQEGRTDFTPEDWSVREYVEARR